MKSHFNFVEIRKKILRLFIDEINQFSISLSPPRPLNSLFEFFFCKNVANFELLGLIQTRQRSRSAQEMLHAHWMMKSDPL